MITIQDVLQITSQITRDINEEEVYAYLSSVNLIDCDDPIVFLGIAKELIYKDKNYVYGEIIATLTLKIDPYNAKALLYKGTCLYMRHDFDGAINQLRKALELDNKLVSVHFMLGQSFLKTEKIAESIESYKNAIKLNSNFQPAYYWLGIAYRSTENFTDAINAFNAGLKINSKDSKCYWGLGSVYKLKNSYIESEKNYLSSLKFDPNNSHILNEIGDLYRIIGKTEQAIKYLSQAIKVDKKCHPAHYNRGYVYFKKGNYARALRDFEKKIALTEEDKENYFRLVAIDKSNEIKKLIKYPIYRKFNDLVQKIKQNLLYEKGQVSHYTGITISKKLLVDGSKFRLSEGAFLNDTSEGKTIFDYLFRENAITVQHSRDTEAKKFIQKPFIGSFVPSSKHDDLALWRMYGKENKEEAKGCAITLDTFELANQVRKKLYKERNPSIVNENELDMRFFYVAYMNDKDEFRVGDLDEIRLDELNKNMIKLKKLVKSTLENESFELLGDEQTNSIITLLNSIAFLFKSIDYQYEQEIRLVINKPIGLETIIDTSEDAMKVFIELVPISNLTKKITLGPKVEKSEEWAAVFHYTLEKRNVRPEIYTSHLPFK